MQQSHLVREGGSYSLSHCNGSDQEVFKSSSSKCKVLWAPPPPLLPATTQTGDPLWGPSVLLRPNDHVAEWVGPPTFFCHFASCERHDVEVFFIVLLLSGGKGRLLSWWSIMLLSVCLFIYNSSLSPPAVLSRVVLHLVASNLHIPEFLLGSVAVLLQPKFYLHLEWGVPLLLLSWIARTGKS